MMIFAQYHNIHGGPELEVRKLEASALGLAVIAVSSSNGMYVSEDEARLIVDRLTAILDDLDAMRLEAV